MSTTTVVYLHCDGGERDGSTCDSGGGVGHKTVKAARLWAKGYGWKRINGKDYCDGCVEEIRSDRAQRAIAGLDPLP